jgi:hypothetical protein
MLLILYSHTIAARNPAIVFGVIFVRCRDAKKGSNDSNGYGAIGETLCSPKKAFNFFNFDSYCLFVPSLICLPTRSLASSAKDLKLRKKNKKDKKWQKQKNNYKQNKKTKKQKGKKADHFRTHYR